MIIMITVLPIAMQIMKVVIFLDRLGPGRA